MNERILSRKLARELSVEELGAVAGAATLTSSRSNVGPNGDDSNDSDDTGGGENF